MKFKAQNAEMHSEKLNIDFSSSCLISRLNDNTFLMKFLVLCRAIIAFETSDRNQRSFVRNYGISSSISEMHNKQLNIVFSFVCWITHLNDSAFLKQL